MHMFQQLGEKIPGVRKIAVLRANGLGDFLFTLPALEALRAAYPQAEIVLLAKAWHANFLQGRPGPVDRVVVVPSYRGVSEGEDAELAEHAAGQERFFQAMREERFDLALQLHGGGKHSNLFILQLGARVTAGLKTPGAAPLDRWLPYIYFQPEILRYLEVVSLVGATPIVLEPRIALVENDIAEARRAVPEEGQPLVAIHPGVQDPQRQWPPEKFAAVGDALAAAGAHVLVTGTPEEKQPVEAVVQAMRARAQPLCGCLTLGGLAGLLSRCRLLVANDSGPLHLAASVGTPTVGIFWCFNLVTAGLLTRSRHRPLVSWNVRCPACGTDRSQRPCDHRPSFVAAIPVEEVSTAALDLYSG